MKGFVISLGLGACLLAACDDLDRGELTARTTAPQAGPACASCHAYPLQDLHHAYHLLNADTLRITKNVNGRITCLDCHNSSMASQVHVLLDSICADDLLPSGWSSIDYPADFRTCMQDHPLFRVDSIRQNRPVPLPARPGGEPLLQEWMTGLAHMNGKVDVVFDHRVIDHANHPGEGAWNPELQTCSAIACHEKHGDYRWAAPSRGLPGLRGHD